MRQKSYYLVEAKTLAVQTILKIGHNTISVADTTGGLLASFLSTDHVCFGGGYTITPRCYDILDIPQTIALADPEKLAAVMARNCLQRTKTDWSVALAGSDLHVGITIANNKRAEDYALILCSSDDKMQLCSIALSLLIVNLKATCGKPPLLDSR